MTPSSHRRWLGVHRKGVKLIGVRIVKHTAGGLHQILCCAIAFLVCDGHPRGRSHLGYLSDLGHSVKDLVEAQLIQ